MIETDQLETDILLIDEEAYRFHYQKQIQRVKSVGGDIETTGREGKYGLENLNQ